MSWSCHVAGCNNSIRHIENRFSLYFIFFCFLTQFGRWRAAAFVSSPIHLFFSGSLLVLTVVFTITIIIAIIITITIITLLLSNSHVLN